jgi:hypothetical protein
MTEAMRPMTHGQATLNHWGFIGAGKEAPSKDI